MLSDKKIWLVFLLAVIFSLAESGVYANSDEISEEDLGIRKETLYDEKETVPAHGEPIKEEAGDSTRIERAFENSPPLIPHDITGMLPLAQTENICMGCHMPEEAVSSGATAIPRSHFVYLGSGKDMGRKLVGDRFNCMQCHVIQTVLTPPVKNLFKGEFRDEGGRYRSNLIDILNEGIDDDDDDDDDDKD
jgi:cytochrome c-type protein NapB